VRAWRGLLVAALPVGLTLAVTEIYFRADTVIISLFRDFDEVGAYALAYRIFELCALVPGVLLASVFPLLSRDLADDPARARTTLQAACDAFLVFGLPLAAGALVLAPEVIRLAAGEGFAEATDPLRILLCAAAVASVNGLFGYALIARDRQRDALALAATGLVINLALNFALVPTYGIVAAAAVTAGSELVIFAGSLWFVRERLGYLPGFGMALRAGLAAAIMAAVVWPIRDETAALTVPVGIVVYCLALYPLGGGALLRRLRAS
jgi:O-antigen/teichoic acid export membrane protein